MDAVEPAVPVGLRRESLFQGIRRLARPVSGAGDDYDGLLEMIGDVDLVFLGGSSHGTLEFDRQRACITKRLILEKGFNAVAVDADWLDACCLDRRVRFGADGPGPMSDPDCSEGFPFWMWHNDEVLEFIGWLARYNIELGSIENQVGLHGLDLYSLRKSMTEVIDFLVGGCPADTSCARRLFNCIDRFGRDPQNYGLLAGAGLSDGCRAKIARHLIDNRMLEAELLSSFHRAAAEDAFLAVMNERLQASAESYYRKLFRSYASSWNLRAEHMMEMLGDLIAWLRVTRGRAKIVVWGHNSLIGDARATELALHGEWSLGQLAREAFPDGCKLIGFTTYAGTVTASSGWCLPGLSMEVRPGIAGGCESMFHHSGISDFWLDLTQHSPLVDELGRRHFERAIGVVYQPGADPDSNYYEASLARQFDAVVHFDLTHATPPRKQIREGELAQGSQRPGRLKSPVRRVAV